MRHNAATWQNKVPSESNFATKSALFGPKNVCPFQILDLTLLLSLNFPAVRRPLHQWTQSCYLSHVRDDKKWYLYILHTMLNGTWYCKSCKTLYSIFINLLHYFSFYKPFLVITTLQVNILIIACIYCRQLRNKTTCSITHGSYSYQQWPGVK